MKIDASHDFEDKARYKVVRLDNFTDVPGEIVTADEDTGECCLRSGDETKTQSFGPGGIRITSRKR